MHSLPRHKGLRIGRLVWSAGCLLFVSLAWQLPSAGAGVSARLVITKLRASRPAVAGRFATVEFTVKNNGRTACILPQLAAEVVDGGAPRPFNIAPPGEAPAMLAAGQSYTFQRFGRTVTPGHYVCRIGVRTPRGVWTPVPFPNGRPAQQSLTVVSQDTAPDVQFVVNDPHPKHIYATGETIRVRVTPIPVEGTDLRNAVAGLTVSTGAKPFSITEPASARSVLLDHPTNGAMGFMADFYGVAAPARYLDIDVSFQQPLFLSSFRLSGTNLNDQFGLRSYRADAFEPGGESRSLPAAAISEGSTWTVLAVLPRAIHLTRLRLRLATSYKLNINRLSLAGPRAGETTTRPESLITYRWQGPTGQPLSLAERMAPFEPVTLTAPGPLQPGYYGLVMTSRSPGMDDLERDYGFVVLAPGDKPRSVAQIRNGRFGMVHMDLSDTFLGPTWIKTLETVFYDEAKESLDAAAWRAAISDRLKQGFMELPLVVGADWDSDSAHPVSDDQLHRLQTKMLQYFKADPRVRCWELGIEENLGYRGRQGNWSYYWLNLASKTKAVRQAAANAGIAVRLIYQVAELDLPSVEAFSGSAAFREFDILSLHPYAWPAFPPPEEWLPRYIMKVRTEMARYGGIKAIWLTEIGAPINRNAFNFMGYPASSVSDRGLSPEEHAGYLVKCHLLALSLGVSKVFWYNYRDAGSDPQFAEDHFGLVDFRGYPKPSYAAYATMVKVLRGKMFIKSSSHKNLRILEFEGRGGYCLAVWQYPTTPAAGSVRVGVSRKDRPSRIVDLYGRPVAVVHGKIRVSGDPVYILSDGTPAPVTFFR